MSHAAEGHGDPDEGSSGVLGLKAVLTYGTNMGTLTYMYDH